MAGRIFLLAAWIVAMPSLAVATPSAPPVVCNGATLSHAFDPFDYTPDPSNPSDPDSACSTLNDNLCAKESDDRPNRVGTPISLCRLIYEKMKDAAAQYKQRVGGPYCEGFTTLYASCSGSQAPILACHNQADLQHETSERQITEGLKQTRLLMQRYLDKLGVTSRKIDADVSNLARHRALACNQSLGGIPLSGPQYSRLITRTGINPAPIQQQISAATQRVRDFVAALDSAIGTHHRHQTKFHDLAAATALSVRNTASEPTGPLATGKDQGEKKSDITGTEDDSKADSPSAPQQGGAQQSGGGGGGSSAGGTAAGELGATGIPVVAAAGARSSPAPGLAPPNNATGGSTTAKAQGLDPTKNESAAPRSYATSDNNGFSKTTSSGSSGSLFGASVASSPSRAGATGGGGGASLGGVGSLGGSGACPGKDCQALGGAAMFGGVGALGSGSPPSGGGGDGGSMGSLGGLDNLFKDDKGKSGASALEGMANLDASTASLDVSPSAEASLAAQGSGDIGGSEGDLFQRLHQFHERAQKRGLVVGMTRRL